MPKLITTPFAVNGQKNEITVNTPESDNSATYDIGFPPVTSLPIASGGKPPKGADFNGLFYDITDNIVSLTKGARYGFNDAYATAIGGYPLGAVLRLDNGIEVESEVNSNTTNPNNDMTGWKLAVSDAGIVTWSGRTQEEKNRDFITPLDYKAKGDGVTDDTQAFANLESENQGKIIDLLGKTYKITTYPRANKYVNGSFKTDSNTYYSEYNTPYNRAGVFATAGALGSRSYNPLWTDSITAIGRGAMGSMTDVRTSIAIGANALGNSKISRDNVCIGDDAGYDIQALTSAYDQSRRDGTRNVCIGGNSGRHIKSGRSNVCIGRNAGQPLQDTDGTVAIGGGALVGDCPIGLDGKIINPFPSAANRSTLVGGSTANFLRAGETVAVGYAALEKTKNAAGMLAVGSYALQNIDSEIGTSGKSTVWSGTVAGTYVQTGTKIVFTFPSTQGAVVGCNVGIRMLDGAAQTNQNDIVPVLVKAVTATTIECESPLSLSANGIAQLRYVHSLTDATSVSLSSTFIGNLAGTALTKAYRSVGVGHGTARYAGIHDSSVSVGYHSAQNSSSFRFSVALGNQSMNANSTYQNCVGLGSDTLNRYIDGSTFTALQNAVAIGAAAQVSANNQIQLGTSGISTYAYGAIQDRSDVRDKTDIEEMPEVMTEFVLGLNPVQGVWDMRDDYVSELFPPLEQPTKESYPPKPAKPSSDTFVFTYEDGLIINRTDLYEEALSQYELDLATYHQEMDRIDNEYDALKVEHDHKSSERDAKVCEWWSNPSKDGSKKRLRKHNWFIAQEVKALADKLGIDFAGLQDHKLIDGTDTLTIGYEEFIPPIVATIQKLNKRLDDIESRLSKLE